MASNDDKTEEDIEDAKAHQRADMRSKADHLFNNSEYKAARRKYEKLFELHEDSKAQLETLLAIASCDEKLGEMKQDVVERISDAVEHCNMSIHDVTTMAEERENSTSAILYLCACKLSRVQLEPEQAFQLIRSWFRKSYDVLDKVGPAATMKRIPLMRDMLEQLRQIEDVDAKMNAFDEARCLNELGYSLHNYCNEYQDAITCFTEGIELMTGYYGSAASKYDIYATLLYNRGCANHILNNYIEAVKDFELSITALKEAEDVDADLKKKRIGESRTSLMNSFASLKRTDPEEANRLKEELQLHEDLTPKSYEGEDPTDDKKKDTTADNYVDVRGGIFVDHTRPIRKNHSVFLGKIGDVESEPVAVKKIEFSQKHEREVRIMLELGQNMNTVAYKTSTTAELTRGLKYIYIAMELCDKETLYEIIKNEELDDESKNTILLQMAHGIKHIHENNIVHGDLKPQNILLSLDGQNVKIADFGLSKKLVREDPR